MTARQKDQLWQVYEATFDAFATDVPELMATTGLKEPAVRKALFALEDAGLVTWQDVNAEAQGASRRGQFKTLTWQCWETYDSTDKEGARATFEAALNEAPKGAEGGTTMEATIPTALSLMEGIGTVAQPDKAPYARLRVGGPNGGKTLAYCSVRKDGVLLDFATKAVETLPAKFTKAMSIGENRATMKVTAKNETLARTLLERLAQ